MPEPDWTPVPTSEPYGANWQTADGGAATNTNARGYHSMVKHRTSTTQSNGARIISRSLEYASGWRTGIFVAIVLSTAVLFLNVAITVRFARHTVKAEDGHTKITDGLSTVYEGSCSTSRSISLGAHLGLNILATVLLGASNYCMQILASPTRGEVDRAHGERRWLRIGVPNVQNLAHIHWSRAVVCILLGISSLPLHLVWNSAIVQEVSSNDYFIGGVTENFVTGTEASAGTEELIDGWFQGTAEHFDGVWSGAIRGPNVTNLTAAACIKTYGQPLIQEYGNVALVFDVQNSSTNSLLFAGTFLTGAAEDDEATGVTGVGDTWVCGLPAPVSPDCQTNDLAEDNGTSWTPLTYAADWPTLASSNPYLDDIAHSNISVRYCLAQRTNSPCRLAITPVIMYAVLAANALKVFCFVCTWFLVQHRARHEGEERLVTNGDMIASYLREPDVRFGGRCLASSRLARSPGMTRKLGLSDVEFWDLDRPMPMRWLGGAANQGHRQESQGPEKQGGSRFGWYLCRRRRSTSGKPKKKTAPRWYTGASGTTWLTYIVPSISTIAACFGVYFGFRLQDKLFIGFGQPSTQATVSFGDGGGPGRNLTVLSSALLANVPQILVTYTYVACNAVLTTMLAHHEVSQLAVKRRGLRVSNPRRGTEQRGTHYLQLPLKIALPLMAASAGLHWLISQSLFLLRVAVYNPDGTENTERRIATVGYSAAPILALLGLLAVFVGGVVVLGWTRRYDGAERMPLVAACSASLAAATCPPLSSYTFCYSGVTGPEVLVGSEDDEKKRGDNTQGRLLNDGLVRERFGEGLAEQKLLWGVIANGDGVVQHATFCEEPVGALMPGSMYA